MAEKWPVIVSLILITVVMYFAFFRKRKEVWMREFERFCKVLQLLPLEREFTLVCVRQCLEGVDDGTPLRDYYFGKGLGFFTSDDLYCLASDVLDPFFCCLVAQRRGELLPGRPPDDDEGGLPLYEWDLEIAREEFERAIDESKNAPWYRRKLVRSRRDDADVRPDIV